MSGIFVGIVSFLISLLFQAQGIPAGDSGDLVTAAATFGVPHPPGYPLYTFLGWLLHFIPISTPAWRVGLLSSLPHAIVAVFVYRLVLLLTRDMRVAILAPLFLVGNYVFFLYSVTPEVFALFDLFVVLLSYLCIRFVQTGNRTYVYGMSITLGLSLTHHHVIAFLIPAIAILLWQERKKITRAGISFLALFGLFLLGLTPYIYAFIAGHGASMVNWDTPTTMERFVQLVTRRDYGTFQAGSLIGDLPIQRLIQIKAFAQYVWQDFTWLGVVGMLVGFYTLWRTKRTYFYFFAVAVLCLGPGFFFYASFPLMNRFTLGTYERFLLPSYVLLSIVLGVGFSSLLHALKQKTKHMRTGHFIVGLVTVSCFVFPVVTGAVTLWKFWGYASDKSAEYVGYDLMQDLPHGAILVVDRDTTLFTGQYVRYAKKYRPDIVLLHGRRLAFEDYQQTIARLFPTVVLPDAKTAQYIPSFLVANAKVHPVFSYHIYDVEEGWFWVPHGLVFQLLPQSMLPPVSEMTAKNTAMWDVFHDPTVGILSHYNHLMLSDVRDIYTTARLEFGKTLMRAGDLALAQVQFRESIRYGGEIRLGQAYMQLGLSQLFLKDCDGALISFKKSREVSRSENPQLFLYESQVYADCIGDTVRGQEVYDLYLRTQESQKTPLNKL
jgi:hypothetical protein